MEDDGLSRMRPKGEDSARGLGRASGRADQQGELSDRPDTDSAFTALGAVSHQAIASVRIQPLVSLVPLWTPVLGVT